MAVVIQSTVSAQSEDGFKVAPLMKLLNQAMQEDEQNLVEQFRGVYGFKIKRADGVEGYWLINAKEGRGKIEYNGQTKPDCVLIMSDDDVMDLLSGKMNPQKGFFAGKIKVQGNMGLAMKLTELQNLAKDKINVIQSKL